MKHLIAIFLLLALSLFSISSRADELQLAVQNIESEWARIYYAVAKEQQDVAYQQLLAQVDALKAQYPDQAELLIQQAIIVASNADNIAPLSALQSVHQARDLLLQAIAINPAALEGAAFVTLGSLYYKVPGWPIAYGDHHKAETMLKKALVINPHTIDANYFYGDFLVTQGRQLEALAYFKNALAVPVRETQVFADTQLHRQVQQAIQENIQDIAYLN